MSTGSRLRREIEDINRHMKREAERWGQTVLWYEFDPASVQDEGPGTDDLDLYDEGGYQVRPGTDEQGSLSRRWKAPKTVQVTMARLDEGEAQYSDEGTYTVDHLTIVVNAHMLRSFGISQPDDVGAHVRDRIEFDGRLFSVDSFVPQGRIADTFLTVTVGATEVKADERMTDAVAWHA